MKPKSLQQSHCRQFSAAVVAATLLLFILIAPAKAQRLSYFSEGFEDAGALDRWAFDGPWEIGVPTFGPPTNSVGNRAHEGNKCAATVLAGNYADDTSGRLVSPSIVVPPATQNPSLRFWHWYSFNCGDYGEVQIKIGTGSWLPLTNATFASQIDYGSSSSGVWSRPSFDLSAYAGRSVQFGFYFSSSSGYPCGNTVAPGWYIDQVAVVTGAVQSIVSNVPDGFEFGMRDWSVDGGTWEVGVPTYGPPTDALGNRAHEGTNCAATVLDGNYADDTSGRLMSPTFNVPASNQNPRLRFWHWYSLGCYDFAQVQIRTANSDWEALATYTSTSSGVWSKPCFDLSAYAGRKVQIGFLLGSSSGYPCGYTVDAGWYVDEVTLVTGAVQTLAANVPDDFESGLGDWCVEGGTWEVGVPTVGPGAHSGANCAATVLSGDYADDTSGRLVSPAFVVPATDQNPRLRFWHWYSLSCGDTAYVQIKEGAGGEWVTLDAYGSSSSGVWSKPCFDLSVYAGKSIQVGFYLTTSSGYPCGHTVAPGWYVDEVTLVSGPIQTLLPNVPDSFESGIRDWSVEGGTWEVGVPTYGPSPNPSGFLAHEGTNCAALVLAGNYADDTSARLVSPPFFVPAADQNPRLRFWHWYSFSCGDAGYVQIKAGANDTWVTLDSYGANSSGVWSKPGFDLSAYAGESVQIGFYFGSSSGYPCGYSVAPGWYIDEVTLVTGPIAFKNPDSFESGIGDWQVDGGTWEVGVPQSGSGSAHDGTSCAATVLGGNYSDDTSGRLVSPPFVVPPAKAHPRLRWWQWYSFHCGDGGYVQITTNADWQTVLTVNNNSANSWNRPTVDLSPYAGQKVRIGFYFSSSSSYPCGYTVAPGWYIDEVRLLHDFGLIVGSDLVRTQETACVSLGVADSTPATAATFTLLDGSRGRLGSPSLNLQGCWIGITTPLPDFRWSFRLTNTCPTAYMGVQPIGTICFPTVSTQSAFASLLVDALDVTGSTTLNYASPGRITIVGNEPLLDPWLDSSQQRMLTTYGKPNTAYEIQYTTDLMVSPWEIGWTNTLPVDALFIDSPVEGTISNVPNLFLRAVEK